MKSNWILGAAVALALGGSPLMAADKDASRNEANGVPGVEMNKTHPRTDNSGVPGVEVNADAGYRNGGAREDAMQQVKEATEVLAKMKRDPDLAAAMSRAKGLLISPDYGRAGLIIGAHGGNGVLLVKNGGNWSGPALYNLGGISIGAQAGASGGQRALLLMTDKAVAKFRQDNKFDLSADAGITIIAWSAKAQARTTGDVIAWSDQVGAYAGASVAVNDINFDERETAALYGRKVEASDIIAGNVKAPSNVTIAQVAPR